MFRAASTGYLARGRATAFYKDMQHTRATAAADYAKHNAAAVSPDFVLNAAIVHATLNTQSWDFHGAAQGFIWDWVCSDNVQYTTFGRAWMHDASMLGDTAFAAALAQVYAHNAQVCFE
jgi:hypothetical protein